MDISSLLSTLTSSSSITNVSKVTGTTKTEVKDVLSAALPALLNGAKEQSEDKSTQEGFLSALASHAKDDTSSISSFLKNVDLDDGAAIVKHLIGGSSSSATKNIAKEFGLYGPFNIQFRMHNSIPYLLEINTRMSGGTHLSCMTGINIPYLAMETAMLRRVDIPEYKKEKMRVSQVETPRNLS